MPVAEFDLPYAPASCYKHPVKTAQHLLATLAAVIVLAFFSIALTNCKTRGKAEQSETETFEETLSKAEQGDAKAQFNLGARYGKGKGVKKDNAEAVKWFRKAAEQGNAEAQLVFGAFCAKGIVVVKNEVEAVKWYLKAAEQGYDEAQAALGDCYAEGKGVEEDNAEAVKWFRKAAEQGLAGAQYKLGSYSYQGIGVVKNDLLAYQWYLLASANGVEAAGEDVSKLEAKLTAEQRAEGQRLATEWQAAFEKRQAEK